MPVLGDKAQKRRVCDHTGDGLSLDGDGTAGELSHTGNALRQLTLSVAVHARYAHDFSRVDRQVHIFESRYAAVVHRVHILHDQDRLPVFKFGALLALDGNGTSHHHLGQGQLGAVLCVHGSDEFSVPDDGDAVRDLNHFPQLVADENDRAPLFRDVPDGAAELVALRRGQHCGGLVQHQHLAVPVQGFQDFHPLLLAHGKLPDDLVGIHKQLILLAQLQKLFPGGFQVQNLLFGGDAENDIFDHGEGVHQFEMLVYHADAVGDGLGGRADLHLLAVQQDLSAAGRVEAVQNVHQRGFSRAVFP